MRPVELEPPGVIPNAPAAPSAPTYGVTGASQGIGRAVVQGIARRGPGTLVVVARRRAELDALSEEVRSMGTGASVCAHPADLSLRSEVERVSGAILWEHPRLDAWVNNAGAWFHRREETSESVERTFALNVLAPLYLTERLRPALRAAAPSRVVMVASEAHRGYRLDLQDLEARRRYRGFRAYGRSKLALIALSGLLSDRYRPDAIDVNSLHPGFVATGFGQNNGGAVGFGIRILEVIAGRSPESGARTPILLATDPALRGTTGRYFLRGRPGAPEPGATDRRQAELLLEGCTERWGPLPSLTNLPADAASRGPA